MIRQATKQDLPAIAEIHRICFPNSYSAQLCRFNGILGGVIYW